ncbi:hypothetical protein BJX66DRAFT_61746 [Aspergillus keveii]|uniref:Uncharacterized protein n=1 Tax=Aspergillus keveii TaxID=714993 RepID=A0ABR4FPZ3_9EURO
MMLNRIPPVLIVVDARCVYFQISTRLLSRGFLSGVISQVVALEWRTSLPSHPPLWDKSRKVPPTRAANHHRQPPNLEYGVQARSWRILTQTRPSKLKTRDCSLWRDAPPPPLITPFEPGQQVGTSGVVSRSQPSCPLRWPDQSPTPGPCSRQPISGRLYCTGQAIHLLPLPQLIPRDSASGFPAFCFCVCHHVS